MLKSLCWQAAFLSVALCWNVYCVAQDAAAPAADPAPAAQEAAPAPAPAAPDFLAQEQAARAAQPDLFKDLTITEKFVKRLPTYWSMLKYKVVRSQTRQAYVIQQEYFTEIAQLKARIERLEKERDAKYRALLTENQRASYDQLVKNAEEKRAAKRAETEAKKDAEVPE